MRAERKASADAGAGGEGAVVSAGVEGGALVSVGLMRPCGGASIGDVSRFPPATADVGSETVAVVGREPPPLNKRAGTGTSSRPRSRDEVSTEAGT